MLGVSILTRGSPLFADPPPTPNPSCAQQLTTSSGRTSFASSHPLQTSPDFPSFRAKNVKRDLAHPENREIAGVLENKISTNAKC